ncbi:cation-transporting P-type ATPase [Streptomyces sp. NPDC047515]|uniref:P-type ATPase n=1 Tax=Streptomyces sp. NPDC047515 TaxID=3155380 RepID=UPI0033FF4352
MTSPAVEEEPGQESCGLAGPEAERRLAEQGRNEVAEAHSASLYARVLAQLRDPLIMVLLGAALLTVVIGDHSDAVVIGLVIVFNTAVGVAQEIRADHAVEALSVMSAPSARVLRDGAAWEAAAAVVVPDDVLLLLLLLGEGDIVAAAAEVLEASSLLIDESMLTGESVPVDKDARSLLASALLAVAALYVPPLQSILETEPLGWSGAALATAALMSGYLAARLTRSAFREAKAVNVK